MHRPYLDTDVPEAWKALEALSATVGAAAKERGLSLADSEFIKLRASQINGCPFCLDVHARAARGAGIPQQKLDLLHIWRDAGLFSDREKALLAVAEAATQVPLSERAVTELAGARELLGDDAFAAAEWVAIAINSFNRLSILSEHPVRPRDADGKPVR